MLKSVIFLIVSDSLKEKHDNPSATEALLLVRGHKTEPEDPPCAGTVQHHLW